MAQKTGSETIGAAGEKNRMTLFKDDRSEDLGAIFVSAIIIAFVMVTTSREPIAPPAAPAAAPATAPAATAAPAAAEPAKPAEPAKK